MIKKLADEIRKKLSKIPLSKRIGKKGTAAVIILLIGAAALIMSELTEKKNTAVKAETTTACADASQYADNLEKRLVSIISAMSGVGRVRVMVTLENSGEDIYLRDTDSEEISDKQGKNSIGRKDEYVIVDDGNGEKGIVVRTAEPEVRGVAVVCDGAGNETVKAQIIQAVTALLNISSTRVSVAPMG